MFVAIIMKGIVGLHVKTASCNLGWLLTHYLVAFLYITAVLLFSSSRFHGTSRNSHIPALGGL